MISNHTVQAPHEGDGLRILVLENSAAGAESTAGLIKIDGHKVKKTPDTSSALRTALDEPPDVVVVDADSPGVDACEFAEEIRRLPIFRRPLVIALSGSKQVPERSASLDAGVHLLLPKPVNSTFLSRVLKRFQSVILPPEDFAEQPDGALVIS